VTALEKCDREIEAIEALIRLGHTEVEGLCLALADWSAERRLIRATEDQSRNRRSLRFWKAAQGTVL